MNESELKKNAFNAVRLKCVNCGGWWNSCSCAGSTSIMNGTLALPVSAIKKWLEEEGHREI